MNWSPRRVAWLIALGVAITASGVPKIADAYSSQEDRDHARDQNDDHNRNQDNDREQNNGNVNSPTYQEGMRHGQDDRDHNRVHQYHQHPDNDADRRAYESGYDQGYNRRDGNDRDRDSGRQGRPGYGQYYGVLAPEWQQKFDSYYSRWQQYRVTNNQGEMRSMEQRMQKIMVNYRIPANVPFDQVASQARNSNSDRR